MGGKNSLYNFFFKTKGLTSSTENEENKMMSAKYRKFTFISKWVLLNSFATIILLTFLSLRVKDAYEIIVLGIGVMIAMISVIKGLFAFFYYFYWNV